MFSKNQLIDRIFSKKDRPILNMFSKVVANHVIPHFISGNDGPSNGLELKR